MTALMSNNGEKDVTATLTTDSSYGSATASPVTIDSRSDTAGSHTSVSTNTSSSDTEPPGATIPVVATVQRTVYVTERHRGQVPRYVYI